MASRSRYSDEQISILVSLIEKHWDILDGPLGGTPLLTAANREHKWNDIAKSVSSVGPSPWTADQIQGKWRDLTSRTRLKANRIRSNNNRTGAGPGVKFERLKPLEERIVALLGQVRIYGLEEDGIDSAASPGHNAVLEQQEETVGIVVEAAETTPEPEAGPIVEESGTCNSKRKLEEMAAPNTKRCRAMTAFEGEIAKIEKRKADSLERIAVAAESALELYREISKRPGSFLELLNSDS